VLGEQFDILGEWPVCERVGLPERITKHECGRERCYTGPIVAPKRSEPEPSPGTEDRTEGGHDHGHRHDRQEIHE